MRRKKTKTGTEIARTYGMREEGERTVWLAVGNRGSVQIFEAPADTGEIELVHSFPWPQGRMKGRELVSDHPGRTFDSWTGARGGHQTGGPRHSFSSEADPKETEALALSKRVASWLKTRRTERRFDRLILVAEPHLLGHLKSSLDKLTARLVVSQHEKDYAWLSQSDLTRRLRRLIPAAGSEAKRLVPPPLGAFRVSKA